MTLCEWARSMSDAIAAKGGTGSIQFTRANPVECAFLAAVESGWVRDNGLSLKGLEIMTRLAASLGVRPMPVSQRAGSDT